MKKLLSKTWVFLLAAFLLFIICGILIAVAISFYPITQQLSFMGSVATNITASYDADETPQTMSSDHVMVFDANGVCRYDVNPDVSWSMDVPEDQLRNAVNISLSGSEHFSFAYDSELDDLLVLKSVPIINEGKSVGAVIVIRNLKNIPESVEGALIVYAVLYWIIIVLFIIMKKRQQRYADLEKNYVANVTHALKAPIASVRAITEALIDVVPTESDAQQPYFGKILKETNIQQHIVQEILSLSKIQSNHMDFSKVSVNACEAMSECLEKYTTYCSLADIDLTISENVKNLPDIRTNPNCINNIMNILLENAVKYGKNGSLSIDAVQSGHKVTFSVTNTRGFILKKELPLIFNRFFIGSNRCDNSGSGLGLSIAKALCDGLNERIWAESSEEHGTTFYFTSHLA